ANQDVVPAVANQQVVAGSTEEPVGFVVADQGISPRAANDVLDLVEDIDVDMVGGRILVRDQQRVDGGAGRHGELGSVVQFDEDRVVAQVHHDAFGRAGVDDRVANGVVVETVSPQFGWTVAAGVEIVAVTGSADDDVVAVTAVDDIIARTG